MCGGELKTNWRILGMLGILSVPDASAINPGKQDIHLNSLEGSVPKAVIAFERSFCLARESNLVILVKAASSASSFGKGDPTKNSGFLLSVAW